MCNFFLFFVVVLFFSMELSVLGGSLLNVLLGGVNKVKGLLFIMYDSNIFEIIYSIRYRIVINIYNKL